MLAAGDWRDWQAECFRTERLQPFKQILKRRRGSTLSLRLVDADERLAKAAIDGPEVDDGVTDLLCLIGETWFKSRRPFGGGKPFS